MKVLKSLVFSYVITGALLFLLAFLLYELRFSDTMIHVGMVVVYLLSAFTGGFYLGKKTGEKKYLWGILSGFLYFLILLLLSFGMNGMTLVHGGSTLTVLVLCSVGGMLGGMMS